MDNEQLNKYFQLLDGYLDGNLGDKDMAEIKTALTQNSDLKAALQKHIEARAQIRQAGEADLKDKFIQEFIQTDTKPKASTPKKEKKSNLILNIGITLLLAFALLFTVLYFMGQTGGKDTAVPQLAQVDDPFYDVLRDENSKPLSSTWNESMKAYKNKEYKSAIKQLELLKDDQAFLKNHSGKYNLTKGVSYLKLNNFEKARFTLSEIDTNNPVYDQAQWYLALCHYYESNLEAAQLTFKEIAENPSHYKRNEAKKYLKNLNQ